MEKKKSKCIFTEISYRWIKNLNVEKIKVIEEISEHFCDLLMKGLFKLTTNKNSIKYMATTKMLLITSNETVLKDSIGNVNNG